MGQTRVDLLHLLEDLRDAYPGSIEETIVAETVANALDSGAHNVAFSAEADGRALVVIDDGAGMTRGQLRRYHDLASTTKKRGKGIGFAGVGIKLALLECDEVVTETRRGDRAYATRWRLASRQKAPWEYINPPGLVGDGAGTALRLVFPTPFSPLLDPGWLVTTLLRGFAPLFDPTFDDVLESAYAGGVRFSVNGQSIPRAVAAGVRILGGDDVRDRVSVAVKLPRKRKPSAVGWLARADEPLAEAERGSDDLARLVESTVWVNDAHPAWHRAAASRAEGYHIALSVAMALAPLAVEPAHAHGFITAFMGRWGEAADGKKKGRGRKKQKRGR